MAITQEFAAGASASGAGSSITVSFSAPPVGTAMTSFIAASVNLSATLQTPSGWDVRQTAFASAITGAIATRISDGTETGITWSVSSGNPTWRASAVGYSTDEGTWVYDNSADNETNLGNGTATSQPSGTVSAAYSRGHAVAGIGSGRADRVDLGGAVDSSYTFAVNIVTTGARPLASVAVKELSATGNTSTTYTTTDTGDEMYGALVVWGITGGGGPSIPPLAWHHLRNLHS